MMKLPLYLLLAGALAFEPSVFGQDEPTIKVNVDLVNVLFTVRNKSNGLVGSLEKRDFKIYDNGKEQTIKDFSRENDLPLTIGLLVDTSLSQQRLLDIEKRAAYQFFEKVLRKKDLAYLIQFGSEAELLQDDTNSLKLLQDGLSQLHMSVPVGGLHPGPVPTQQNMAGTILYDAVYLAANEKMKNEVGRKAIVLITDGVDQGSKTSRDQAIEYAQKSDSIIYSIQYLDPSAYGGGFGTITIGGGQGEAALKRMSDDTGGRVFRVDRHHTLDQIFQELQDEMRSQYSISYEPSNPERDGSYHKLEIKMASKEYKDYKVQARKGYYAMGGGN